MHLRRCHSRPEDVARGAEARGYASKNSAALLLPVQRKDTAHPCRSHGGTGERSLFSPTATWGPFSEISVLLSLALGSKTTTQTLLDACHACFVCPPAGRPREPDAVRPPRRKRSKQVAVGVGEPRLLLLPSLMTIDRCWGKKKSQQTHISDDEPTFLRTRRRDGHFCPDSQDPTKGLTLVLHKLPSLLPAELNTKEINQVCDPTTNNS